MSENRKRHMGSRLTPIACRVCDKVFFNNVSLVLHFECHLGDEKFIAPRMHDRDLALLPSGRRLPLNFSSFSSSVEGMAMSEASRAAFPKMNKRLKPLSVLTPNAIPTDASLVDVPVLNSIPSINLYDVRRNALSKPFRHSPHPLGYKNPGKNQLEKPVQEIIVISDDEDENKNADEIDLTLKL
ncbi:hypothetical protein CASFOL_021508 [Castilleja foliolosa]|uniref:C2H2-type domain-containing protein n=1 Tax=Castilleja foliolosa TaxID=1961234 RepID=A0ABD3CY05_9LAMI